MGSSDLRGRLALDDLGAEVGAGAAVRILRVLLALPPGQSKIRNPHGEAMRIDAAEVQQDVACNMWHVSKSAGRKHLEW